MVGVKFVPDRMVVGPHGIPVLESGYAEIHGVRMYPDRLVVGRCGQPELRSGYSVSTGGPSTRGPRAMVSLGWPRGRRP